MVKKLEACVHAKGGHFEQLCAVCLTFKMPHITTGSFQSQQHLKKIIYL